MGKHNLLIWLSVIRKETELDNNRNKKTFSRKGGPEPRLAGEVEDVKRGVTQQGGILDRKTKSPQSMGGR